MIIRITIIFFTFIILNSCETTTTPSGDATRINPSELTKTPGYEWYDIEIKKFSPDLNLVNQIKSQYNFSTKFLLFVNPSCACVGTQKTFPAIMKILSSANIPDSNIVIYSMLNYTYKHPYTSFFKINELPSAYSVNNGKYYSILDSLNIYRIKNPTDTIGLIERFVLNSLK